MSFRLNICLLGLGLALAAQSATAEEAGDPAQNQSAFQSRVWRKADGLPQDSVTAVLQTRDGFLWVGTQNGLARFDGVHFAVIPLPGAQAGRLWVTDLCEDQRGRLWIGTQQHGLYSLSDGTILHYQKAEGLSDDSIASLATDHSGNLWIGTHLGLDLWNGKSFKQYTTKDGLPDNNISSVYVARSGTIWITTRSGVSVFGAAGIRPYHFDVESQGRSPEFLGVYEDRQHNLWAYGDTYLINLNENKRFNYFRGSEAASVRIWTFYQGRDSRLWIGTSGRGLFQFTGERFRPVTIRNGRLPNDVRAICEDREGSLWLGTDGGGLIQLRTERIRNFGPAQGLPAKPATCLAEDSLGRIWAGFGEGGVFFGDAEHFEPYVDSDTGGIQQYVRSLCGGPDTSVWVAPLGEGLSVLRNSRRMDWTTADGLSDNQVTATSAGPNGPVWVGTADGHVYRFDGQHLRVVGVVDGAVNVLLPTGTNGLWIGTDDGEVYSLGRNAFLQSRVAGTLIGHSISAMCDDSSGRLWIGTVGAGLACLRGDSLKTWTTQDGLPDMTIDSVAADAEGNLWLTAGNGIYRVERADMNDAIETGKFPWVRPIESFSPGEMTSVGWPATLLSHDRLLWFATGHGIVCFDPRGWVPDRIPPPVYLESVRVNGQLLKPFKSGVLGDYRSNAAPVRVSSNMRGLDFEFTAPCLAAPEKVRFLYKLEGFDADWIEGNALTRRVHYGSLSYGHYTFRVIACNPDGIWDRKGASFSFMISPPWWRAPWTLAAYCMVAALLVAALVRFVSHRRLRLQLQALEHSQEMARERMRIAQDMHDEIGSKLARISFLSEDLRTELRDRDNPDGKVASISTTSRDLLQSLDQMVWAVNPRNDTVEHLVAYLGQYATEYFQNTSIQCAVHLPPHFPDAPLSADVRHNALLAFKEVLSNAMKHSGAALVTVEMKIEDSFLEIHIADNGSGFELDPNLGEAISRGSRRRHGISGLKRRLQSVGGACELKSAFGQGTTVVFRVPLRSLSRKSV